jgi:hypothetical protein
MISEPDHHFRFETINSGKGISNEAQENLYAR